MKNKIWKRLSILAVGSILIASLAACGKEGSTGGDSDEKVKIVKIGTILPLSGAAAQLGENSKKSIDMAVEEINENGGIKSLGGAKLEIVYGDSQGKPPVGVSEAERLLSNKDIVLLNGAWQSGVTLPASEVAERNKKVWLAPVASDDSVTSRGFEYVFRIADTSAMRVAGQVEFINYLSTIDPIKTVALVYENTAWGQGVANSWKEQLPAAGYEIVLEEGYDGNAAELTPVATKVKSAKPDAVLMVSYLKDATLLTKAFTEQKVTPKAFIATSGGYADAEYLNNVGDAPLGFFDIAAWEADVNRPFSKETNDKFIEKYGHGMNGEMVKEYVGIYTIADVLERAGSVDSEKIRDAFASTNIVEGPTQMYAKTINFDETGTLPEPGLVFTQFQEVDGKVQRVTVFPLEDARDGAEIVYPYAPK
ncbi:ABC transporter substrate-binding protein [Sporosarcina sp. FA9]|uniref:ABC transporter substrate-binding protein n=1 Tax=Sporosarcina sp. FA9 TaxID=3413030 RepID=UPI003F65EB8D